MQKLRICVPVGKTDVHIENYIAALEGLGAEPVSTDSVVPAADFDGLLLPGGQDVDPKSYHGVNVACGRLDEELDVLELALIHDFIEAGKPIFGICRGHQLISCYFGGDMIQDLPTGFRHKWTPEGDNVHTSSAEADSFIGRLYGTHFATNSSHHQAVNRVGEGLRVVQVGDEDGVVEAIEHVSLPITGVQWHPERMCFAKARTDTVDGSLVIRNFLEMCQRVRNEK